MRGRARGAVVTRLVAVLAVVLAAAAGPASADEGRVVLVQPELGQPLFGPVVVEAEVIDATVKWVDLFVDGSRVAHLDTPPYRAETDLGQANVEHHFVARAETVDGRHLETSITSPAIAVDDEVDVELVQLFMTVLVWDGRAPSQLTKDDFVIRDASGRTHPVVTLGRGDLPLSTVLLVDSSESMVGEPLRRAIAGSKTVTTLLREQDEVLIALYSDRLLRATAFTDDPLVLDAALRDARAEGGTAVADHLYFALNRLEPRLGRPVVILFSDGLDVSSQLDMEDVQHRVRRSQATVFWIRVGEEDDDGEGVAPPLYRTSWRTAEANRRQLELLEQTVDESGGRIVTIPSIDGLARALGWIYDGLRKQLVLGFQPVDRRRDGTWNPITVAGVKGAKVEIDTRAGYID